MKFPVHFISIEKELEPVAPWLKSDVRNAGLTIRCNSASGKSSLEAADEALCVLARLWAARSAEEFRLPGLRTLGASFSAPWGARPLPIRNAVAGARSSDR